MKLLKNTYITVTYIIGLLCLFSFQKKVEFHFSEDITTTYSFITGSDQKRIDKSSSHIWDTTSTEDLIFLSPVTEMTNEIQKSIVESNRDPNMRDTINFASEQSVRFENIISQDSSTLNPIIGRKIYYYYYQWLELSSTTFLSGDTIILKNGKWNNIDLKFRGKGTEKNPVVFIAETPGEVLLTGSSTLIIDGIHVVVSSLFFNGPTSMRRNHVVLFTPTSTNCRFTNSVIKDYNPIDTTTWKTRNTKYISLYGTRNRVDHCNFENKRNLGSLMTIFLQNGVKADHQIDHNHFYKRISLLKDNGGSINGQDIITVGNSSTSSFQASCIVEYNLFEECNGEVEIISNKSCSNLYRHNIFYKNAGTLTLRCGHNCSIYGNFFLGGGIEGSGGIRIIGENHTVYNNFFQNLTGSGYRAAICIVNGDKDGNKAGYEQVKNAQIIFNTFHDCANVFNVGFRPSPLPPIYSIIEHNVILSTDIEQTVVLITNSNSNIGWKNNLMNKGTFINFIPSQEQFLRTDFNFNVLTLHPFYGICSPMLQSFLSTSFNSKDYPQIIKDFFCTTSDSLRTIGGVEISYKINMLKSISKSVGCSFL